MDEKKKEETEELVDEDVELEGVKQNDNEDEDEEEKQDLIEPMMRK